MLSSVSVKGVCTVHVCVSFKTYLKPSLGYPGAASIAAASSSADLDRAVSLEMTAEEGRLSTAIRVHALHSPLNGLIGTALENNKDADKYLP